MAGMNRLPAPFGAWIDRSKPVAFTFEGKQIEGFDGDNIASALRRSAHTLLSKRRLLQMALLVRTRFDMRVISGDSGLEFVLWL